MLEMKKRANQTNYRTLLNIIFEFSINLNLQMIIFNIVVL